MDVPDEDDGEVVSWLRRRSGVVRRPRILIWDEIDRREKILLPVLDLGSGSWNGGAVTLQWPCQWW